MQTQNKTSLHSSKEKQKGGGKHKCWEKRDTAELWFTSRTHMWHSSIYSICDKSARELHLPKTLPQDAKLTEPHTSRRTHNWLTVDGEKRGICFRCHKEGEQEPCKQNRTHTPGAAWMRRHASPSRPVRKRKGINEMAEEKGGQARGTWSKYIM